jgi:hypothetical protein
MVMKQKLVDAILDTAASSWTWLGMIVAFAVTPDGSTKDSIGGAIVALMILWLVTGPLRWGRD